MLFIAKFQSIQSQQSKAHFFVIEQKKHELHSIITLKAIQKYIYNLFVKIWIQCAIHFELIVMVNRDVQHFAWILFANKQVREYIYNIQHIYSQIIFFFYFQYDFAEKSKQSCWSVNLKYSVNMSACVKFSRRDNGEPILLIFEYYFSFIFWKHLVQRASAQHIQFESKWVESRVSVIWCDFFFIWSVFLFNG